MRNGSDGGVVQRQSQLLHFRVQLTIACAKTACANTTCAKVACAKAACAICQVETGDDVVEGAQGGRLLGHRHDGVGSLRWRSRLFEIVQGIITASPEKEICQLFLHHICYGIFFVTNNSLQINTC